VPALRTLRLELVAADAALSRAGVEDRARLAELLDASVPAAWPPALFAEGEAEFAKKLEADAELEGWMSWYVVRVGRARTLVGVCGLGGPPNERGEVMLGYAVLDEFQKKGYATEAAGALIDWAFEDPRTRAITAQTYEHLGASIRVMEKNGLKLVERGPEPGLLTFALRRPG
jgi:RimJ/RimL family protein N-acetyltransferase